jgi:hypothetical protein
MKELLRYFILHKTIVSICCTVVFFLLPGTVSGQSDTVLTFYKVTLEPQYGFITPHNNSMKYLVRKPVWGADWVVFRRTAGNRMWHRYYRKPSVGLGLHYMNLGNPEYFGHAFAVFASTGFHFTEKEDGFVYLINYGFSYLSKRFDASDNYYNIAIGSHVNVFLKVSLGYQAEINHVSIRPYISFIHYSNGSFHKPNLGINILNAGLTAGLPVKKRYDYPCYGPITEHPGSYAFSLISGIAFHQKDPPLSPVYAVYVLRLEAERIYSRKHSWGGGIDYSHDRAILFQKDYPEHNPSRVGAYLHYSSFFGKFTFSAQSGVYIYDKYIHNGPVFTRLGLSYKVWKNLRTCVFLKSHFFVADFIEFSVRYTFYKTRQ